ncbi:replication initiation protein [Brachybacterium sp. Marseille-Q7125]|uniref:replication initiation protein n=1 Tax=Brachybacterium sp. Marseille-Q7125 TaxID=2932815 RepID=UPI001FF247DD|nr:replication initiation protein [Brachybacterium sp. Marseille-Q7125]
MTSDDLRRGIYRKPLAYAAAITEGLRRSADGDQGYSGLITKNPEHASWEAHWLTDRLYGLQELQEHLGHVFTVGGSATG